VAKRQKRRSFGRIRKLPSGHYQARYPGPDGLLRPADRTFATITDADLWLSKKRVEIEERRWIDPDAGLITVGDWAARWLAAVSPQLKAKTRESYRSLINSRIKPSLGDRELSSLRPIAVAEWIGSMRTEGLSASRIRQAYRVLSQLMASAVDNELIAATPCHGIRLPRMPQTEPHILTPLEASRLVRATAAPHDLLVGLSPSRACGSVRRSRSGAMTSTWPAAWSSWTRTCRRRAVCSPSTLPRATRSAC
jgi:hypothetical protein